MILITPQPAYNPKNSRIYLIQIVPTPPPLLVGRSEAAEEESIIANPAVNVDINRDEKHILVKKEKEERKESVEEPDENKLLCSHQYIELQ